MNFRRVLVTPRWLRLPRAAGVVVGVAYSAWAFWKLGGATVPRWQCDTATPLTELSRWMDGWEIVLGVLVAAPRSRSWGALLAVATNIGLVGFAIVADARGIPWQACDCFGGGIELSWGGHAAVAAGLASLFALVLLNEHAETTADYRK